MKKDGGGRIDLRLIKREVDRPTERDRQCGEGGERERERKTISVRERETDRQTDTDREREDRH